MFRTADDYYNHEYSQVQDFSLQTVLSTQATECGFETEANEIVSRMYGQIDENLGEIKGKN